MAYQEKSAWIMSIALIAGTIAYFGLVQSLSGGDGALASPSIPMIMKFTFVVVVVAIVGHAVTAALAPSEASAELDERERQIMVRAGHYSGYVFGFGVISSLGVYLFVHNGDLLFYSVFASLLLSQIVEYLTQIVLYRTAL